MQLIILARLMALFLVLLISACSTMPGRPERIPVNDYQYTIDYATWLIKKEMGREKIPGVSIAVVDDQQVVWSSGFGFADVKEKVPATSQTLYRAGSLTKLLTAIAIMQLQERGLLNLDDAVQLYLPDLHLQTRDNDAPNFTIREVLSHQSGLPSEFLKGMWSEEPIDFRSLPGKLIGEYVAQPPSVTSSYSNLGYSLLGIVIERVSGLSYSDYVKQRILTPMGMGQSYVAAKLEPLSEQAKGYRYGKEQPIMAVGLYPAAGLVSSVDELSLLLKMMFAQEHGVNEPVLSNLSLQEMITRQNGDAPFDLDQEIGLGWFLESDSANLHTIDRIKHSGSTPLFNCKLLADPNRKVGVIVMANSDDSLQAVSEITRKVFWEAVRAKEGVPKQRNFAKKANIKRTAQPRLANIKTELQPGYYTTQLGLIHIVQEKNGKWVATMDKHRFLLDETSNQLYQVQIKVLGMLKLPIPDLDDFRIASHQINDTTVLSYQSGNHAYYAGEKIELTPVSDVWKQRLGEYQIINRGKDDPLFDHIQLKMNNGFLEVSYHMIRFQDVTARFVLKPVSDDEAVIQGKGRYMGETIHVNSTKKGEVIYWAGYELQKVMNEN